MRNPGLEQATRVAVRSYASAAAIDARAGDSVPSPPPSGDTLGESDLPQPGLDGARAHPMDDIDTARAQEYALLSPQALIASCSSTINAPWVGRLFADLERAEGADFYRHVGVLGRVFVQIETQAFALPS
jgi:hypothetical protein